MLLGVISDTHGLLRPEAVQALRGVQLILHAGDIGAPEVIDALRALAPVTAVRGNCDRAAWAQAYPEQQTLVVEGVTLCLVHDRHDLEDFPSREACQVVISGHSHEARREEVDGVLYLNPGSAGPRRFKLPVTLALLTLKDGKASAEIVDLGRLP
jgi:uncharacterized protein